MQKYNILVSGVGAVIGYGIIRSLKSSCYKANIIGTDINLDAVGRSWCDIFEPSPLVADHNYPNFLKKVISRHAVDLIIPGIEQDVTFFAQAAEQHLLQKFATRVALNNPKLVSMANDKWLTHLQLVNNGFNTIPTRINGGFNELATELGLPMLIKPRGSYASKGIHIISTPSDLYYWQGKLGDDFMVQSIVGSDEDEYTVGTFGLGLGKCIRPIIFKRKLSREGATSKAIVCNIPELDKIVRQLVKLFAPIGPTNFQFRKHNRQFLLLELNPRISSSTSLRAAFGYNEAEMCIEYFLEQKKPRIPKIRFGRAERYIEDLVTYTKDAMR